MNQSEPLSTSAAAREKNARSPAWPWLAVGVILLPFTIVQTMLPLAAWFAPIFLLRYARTARRARVALPMIFLAQAIGAAVAMRGGEIGDVFSLAFGLIVFSLFRGVISTLPYAADRLIGPRLGQGTRTLVFPLAFTSVEWLIATLATPNSSGSSLYSQYDSATLMQILSITGMWGVAFLIG
jgi:apolipoprotein N-acyltransferase